MVPKKRKKGGDGEGGRGGFEVRVIGGGQAAPVESSGRSLQIGLRIGSGGTTERARLEGDPSDESVHRLGAAEEDEEPLQARQMSEVGPAEPRVSSRGRKAKKGLTHWTVWMAVATCLVAVAAVVGLMVVGKGKPSNADSAPGYVFIKEQELDQDQEYFLVNAGELTAEAEKLLAQYAAATSVEQVLPMVRDAERVKDRMSRLWQPWGSGTMLAAGGKVEGVLIDDSKRPGICLKGRKGDFSRFEMVFIREAERLKLDWEASYGMGEIQIAELQEGKLADGQVVRGSLRPAEFYTREFPEAEFGSFRMVDASGDHFIWVFARLGSEVAKALEQEFNERSVLLDKSGEIRATVRLSGPGGGSGKCHEITEMLHKGWVTP